MKKRLFLIVSFLVLVSIPLIALAPVASAASCNGVETSVDFQCDKWNTDGISAILLYVINFMAVGVGIAVVIGIIFGGITYAMSDGEESKAKEGREIITNSVIGLFLFIFLYAGMNFFIPGGVFNLNAKPAVVATNPSGGGGGGSTGETPSTSISSSTDKIYNFRDVGTSSGVMKSGVLFRSAELSTANNSGQTKLETLLKGGTVIDLRRTDEIKTEGSDPKLSGVAYIHDGISGTYSGFVSDSASRHAIGSAIKAVANASGPVLIHCKYGKDRTGWTVAMIMYALGASDSQVMDEYKASNNSDRFPGADDVKEKKLNDTLDAAKEKYGSIRKYLTNGLGLSDANITALKEKLGN